MKRAVGRVNAMAIGVDVGVDVDNQRLGEAFVK